MTPQFWSTDKSLLTYFTRVIFLSCVLLEMCPKMAALVVLFIANVTGIRFLSSVDSDMISETLFCGESFGADMTQVGPVIAINSI